MDNEEYRIAPKPPEVGEEKQTLTPERIAELKSIAAQKAREYDTQDEEDFYSYVFNTKPEATESNTPPSLMVARSRLTDEIGRRFEAHGIAKGTNC
jgi:hypothetical protein